MTGTLLESPQGKKRVRLKVGEGEILANVGSLVGLARLPQPARSEPRKTTAVTYRRTSQTLAPEDIQETLDVRGQAADDALDIVVAGLDRGHFGREPVCAHHSWARDRPTEGCSTRLLEGVSLRREFSTG
jgi:DNA mismatch repair protein MutS2